MWLTNINYVWLEHLKAYSFMALGYIRAQLLRNSHSSLLLISFLKSPCMTQTGLLPSLWQFDQSQHVGREQYWSGGREHDTRKGNLKWQVTGFLVPCCILFLRSSAHRCHVWYRLLWICEASCRAEKPMGRWRSLRGPWTKALKMLSAKNTG